MRYFMGFLIGMLAAGGSCYGDDAVTEDFDVEAQRVIQSKEAIQQFLTSIPGETKNLVVAKTDTTPKEEREKIRQEIRNRIICQLLQPDIDLPEGRIEEGNPLDTSEIDDDVLDALKELDQTQDMNMSFKQKLWLFYVYISMQTGKAKEKLLEFFDYLQEKTKNAYEQGKVLGKKAKDTTVTHVSDHKKEYIIGASVLTAAVLAIIIYRKLHAPAAAGA